MPEPVSPPTELDRRVGVQLRRLRRALGLTQAELAAVTAAKELYK